MGRRRNRTPGETGAAPGKHGDDAPSQGKCGGGCPAGHFLPRISPASAQGRRNAPGAPVVPPPALRAAHRAVSVPSVFYTLCAPQADSSLSLSSPHPESQGDGAEGDRQEEPGGDLQGEIEGIILAQPVPFAAHFSPECAGYSNTLQKPLLQFGNLFLMLTLPGLSLVLEDRRRAGKKLLLPDVEKIGMNGQFAADRGNGDAILEMAHHSLCLFVWGKPYFRHSDVSLVVLFLTYCATKKQNHECKILK